GGGRARGGGGRRRLVPREPAPPQRRPVARTNQGRAGRQRPRVRGAAGGCRRSARRSALPRFAAAAGRIRLHGALWWRASVGMKRLLASQTGLFVAVAAVGVYFCAALPGFAQEGYYWSYSQHPGLSYFDHPPMVAWLIWLGTAVLGDGALGIRICTLLCSLGLALCGLGLLRQFGAGGETRRAWLALGLGVPMYAALHMLTNPD